MPSRTWTRQQAIARYKKGYGQGHGSSYRPWLEPKDVPSQGTSRRAPGRDNGRQHSLFSDHEWAAFLACERLREVIDIREQFPLWHLDETIEISQALGFKHPAPRGAEPQVMTTDLLLTMRDGTEAAIAVKPSKKLDEVRVLQKLDIERIYWERRGIAWSTVTELDVPPILFVNLRALVGRHQISANDMLAHQVEAAEAELRSLLASAPQVAIGEHCIVVDGRLNLAPGSSMNVVKNAIANRRWDVRLDLPLDPSSPLSPRLGFSWTGKIAVATPGIEV